jgi:hypothetical protein
MDHRRFVRRVAVVIRLAACPPLSDIGMAFVAHLVPLLK